MTDEQLERLLALDGTPGPALAIDAAHADAIVDAALVGAGFGPGGGGGGGAGGAAAPKLAIVGGAALVIVAIALLAGRGKGDAPPAVAVVADAAIDAPTGTGSAVAADEITADDEPPVIDMSEMPARRRPLARDSAADLLAEANAKRAAKQWRASDALYARVVERAPKTLAAQTALVASAALHLEHLGDPKGAARRFRRALAIAPRGAVAEEARWGLAEAARASHDPAGEKAALDEFLAHHASSPLAPRARARRAELP